jgi:ketosteroid isomerase-like protein
MVICPRCDVEYDKGETICGMCGTPLMTVKEPSAPPSDKQANEGKKELRICPQCKMLFEKATHCLRCGTSLVAPGTSEPKEEPQSPPAPEKKDSRGGRASRDSEVTHGATFFPRGKTSHEPGTPCDRSDDTLSTHLQPHECDETSQQSQETEVEETYSPHEGKATREILSDKMKDMWSDLITRVKPLPYRVIAVAAVIILLIVVGRSMTKRTVESSPSLPIVTMSTTPVDVRVEDQEIERIKDLLENIRQANLREDIELFMSCYAEDFTDREGKKQSTLESWKDSDYLDLSYKLKNQAISGDTASVEVEWIIKILQEVSGKSQEGRIVIDALLKKGSNGWKIKEIRTAG